MDNQTFSLKDKGVFNRQMLIVGAVAFGISLIGLFVDSRQFFFSYLVAWVFWVSVGLGAMFFVMLSHLTGTVWGIVLRRISEAVMMSVPLLALGFIPILLGMHHLYEWTHPEVVAAHHVLQAKTAYLNIPFFAIRSTVYFLVWYLVARKLYKTSLEQDKLGGVEQIQKMRKVSALGMVLFALTITFAAFDWLMSLQPEWYSTIYGLYIFSGGFVAALAFIILAIAALHRKKVLTEQITVEHYHDLAKLLMSFTIFWGYMAFSQYFLIWYANIPEETVFYLKRWEGSWKVFGLFLVFGNFLVPFLGLMSRAAKRNVRFLQFIALWTLFGHWVDLYWNAVPVLHPQGIRLSWMDLTLFVGFAAFFLMLYWMRLRSNPVLPVGDPNLQKSITFVNS
ncbi:hypothetical protein [Caldithrix abyssi]|nr:hypothetical protein [Caldithrix abyssi]APF19857.1 hypothetical protein Cabys_3109 [Caldithrix abyssi DSM 13497]